MTGNFHRVFDGGDPVPTGLASVALLAGAGVESDPAQAAVFRHLGQFNADDFLIVPSRAELYGEGNFHRRAHGFEDIADRGQVAQQAGAAVALHDFFRGTSEIEVDQIESQALDDFCRFRHHLGIAAEKLGRDGMLVSVET